MKKVIVSGSNGFIGTKLISKLVSKKISVVALCRSASDLKLQESSYITKIVTSLDNVDELMKSIPNDNYDAFYHFAWAGVNGPLKADPYVQLNNIEIMMNCAKVAKKLDVKKFLCAGTIAEKAIESLPSLTFANSGMMYGAAKHAAHIMLETYCKCVGMDFIWMQFSNIFGPSNKTGNLVSYTIGELKQGNEACFGPAQQPYDFIFIEDLIEAIYRLGEKETLGNYYFIGSGKPRILKEYLLEIGNQYGNSEMIKIGVRPDDGIKYAWNMFDILPLEKEIGKYVSVSFTEGIKRTMENY